MTDRIRRLTTAFVILTMGGYVAALRPRLLHWRATGEEYRSPLPGDSFVSAPNYATTRAITIRTPTTVVWPWLVQMGPGRADSYTHIRVERLLRSGLPDVHTIHPE